MKKAPQKLIEALLYKPVNNSTNFIHKDNWDGGTELYKLYWSQEGYDVHRNNFRHNNYALLQSGLLVTNTKTQTIFIISVRVFTM
jgi:hypothetical protein